VKVLYLADNSDLPNWGCRATSMSLRQLIAGAGHEIVGTVTGHMIESQYPTSEVIGDAVWAMVSRTFNRDRIRRLPLAAPVLDWLGRRNALSHDLKANIETLKRARAWDPATRGLFEQMEACEAVVVNGEGDLIFATPARPRLLYTLAVCELALSMGKSLYYLNAMASECPTSGINAETLAVASDVLGRASAFTVRDPASLAFVKTNMPGVATAMFPDAVFSWSRLLSPPDGPTRYDRAQVAPYFERTGHTMPAVMEQPYAAIGGGSRAAREPARAIEAYLGLVAAMKAVGLPLLLAPGCGGDLFLEEVSRRTGVPMLPLETPIFAVGAMLANARVFVSGRWHPSIMASLGGTPCVFMGSNSHKTLTIQTMLENPDPREFAACPSAEEAVVIAARAKALVEAGEAERARLLAVTRKLSDHTRKLAAVIASRPVRSRRPVAAE
jgi:hypothetical protein